MECLCWHRWCCAYLDSELSVYFIRRRKGIEGGAVEDCPEEVPDEESIQRLLAAEEASLGGFFRR